MKQIIEINTHSGRKKKIGLEDWVDDVIRRALEKHIIDYPQQKQSPPLNKQLLMLEMKCLFLQWLIIPCYIVMAVWIVYMVVFLLCNN